MKYFLDTEFIENGETIDLISIGIICEDGRTYYAQNAGCKFTKASDWVWRNVFPHLLEFTMSGDRSCNPKRAPFESALTEKCWNKDCCWKSRFEMRDEIKTFCDPLKYGKPEFWGYYCDYDWVVFCQIFGSMIDLPKGFPMYCQDVKQLCNSKGDPHIPKPDKEIHHALVDAEWVKFAYNFLTDNSNIPIKTRLGIPE